MELNELRKIAEAATPGPWGLWNPAVGESHIAIANKVAWRSVVSATGFVDDEFIPHWADANHIATFDPPTVLALLSRLEQAEAQVARVREIAKADLKCPCCSGYEEILRTLDGEPNVEL